MSFKIKKKITPNNFQKYHFLFQNTRIYSLEKNPNAMLYDNKIVKIFLILEIFATFRHVYKRS